MKDSWKQAITIIKPFIPPIIIGSIIIGLIVWLKPPIVLIIASVIIIGAAMAMYHKQIRHLWNSLQGVVLILFLWGVYKLLGGNAILALVVVCVIIVAWLLYKRWKLFINTIREIEIMIWGKTNDKKKEKNK